MGYDPGCPAVPLPEEKKRKTGGKRSSASWLLVNPPSELLHTQRQGIHLQLLPVQHRKRNLMTEAKWSWQQLWAWQGRCSLRCNSDRTETWQVSSERCSKLLLETRASASAPLNKCTAQLSIVSNLNNRHLHSAVAERRRSAHTRTHSSAQPVSVRVNTSVCVPGGCWIHVRSHRGDRQLWPIPPSPPRFTVGSISDENTTHASEDGRSSVCADARPDAIPGWRLCSLTARWGASRVRWEEGADQPRPHHTRSASPASAPSLHTRTAQFTISSGRDYAVQWSSKEKPDIKAATVSI